MRIRIVRAPAGEAPEEIRQAWVGLELPLSSRHPGLARLPGWGVLSGPKTFWRGISHLLFRPKNKISGYAVPGDAALELLAKHAPVAAEWWRQNAPHVAARGQILLFDAQACEEIPDY